MLYSEKKKKSLSEERGAKSRLFMTSVILYVGPIIRARDLLYLTAGRQTVKSLLEMTYFLNKAVRDSNVKQCNEQLIIFLIFICNHYFTFVVSH